MRVQLAAFWGSHDPSPLNKTRYSAFVEVVFSSSPLFCSPLPPNPPPQGKPPGERATPARRPAASKLKKDLNFQDRISERGQCPNTPLFTQIQLRPSSQV